MADSFYQILERSPVIAAVFSTDDFQTALDSPCEIIFLLGGNICELEHLLEQTHSRQKRLFVHIDLLGGIGRDQYSVRHLKQSFQLDGIITTKSNIARFAKEEGLFIIQRFFMLDSKSFESADRSVSSPDADAVEILPGIMPSVIKQISKRAKVPVIAGGLVRSKKEAIDALNAGAMGVSTSCKALWSI